MTRALARLASLREQLKPVLEPLSRAGIGFWLVGGVLRDALLDREFRDLDLLISSDLDRASRALPDGRRFGAARPILAVAAEGERPAVEISAARAPLGERNDPTPDLVLRDFTCNALAWELRAGRWIDPLGGRRDIAARTLRSCGPDALRHDPVRILRGIRLCQEFGFVPEPGTEAALGRAAPALSDAAPERIRDEFLRLLELPEASAGIRALRHYGALAGVLPELLRTVGIGQNRYHPDDVFVHSLRVCDGLPPVARLRLAALLHDAAKPETKRYSAERREHRFLRHELAARVHVERAAKRLRLSNRDRIWLTRVVRHHLLFPDQLTTGAALRRMIRRVGRDILNDVIEFRRADLAARSEDGCAPPDWLATEARIQAELDAVPGDLAISGREVMHELGLAPGRAVGRWLVRARRHVQEHPEQNQLDRLRAWLRDAAGRPE